MKEKVGVGDARVNIVGEMMIKQKEGGDWPYESVLIITYGRSGSTLLMGLLNTIDGFLVRGENNNFFFNLYLAWIAARKSRRNGDRSRPNHPFYGAGEITDELLIRNFRSLARSIILGQQPNEGIRCIGFKEVRYPQVRSKLKDFLDFLEIIFPNPLFVFNTRNLDDVVTSGFYQRVTNKQNLKDILTETELAFAAECATRPNSFTITYEDMVCCNDKVRELHEKLGVSFDEGKVRQLLAIDHSPQTPTKLRKRRSLVSTSRSV